MNIHAASFLEKKTGAFYVFNARTKGIENFICLRGVEHLNFLLHRFYLGITQKSQQLT